MTAMLSSRASRFLATRDLLNKMQETDYGLTYCGGEGGSRTLGTRKGSLDLLQAPAFRPSGHQQKNADVQNCSRQFCRIKHIRQPA